MAPDYLAPGIYVEEAGRLGRAIVADETALTVFMAPLRTGPLLKPVAIGSWAGFERHFGGLSQDSSATYAVSQFFQNGGAKAIVVRIQRPRGHDALRRYEAGMQALDGHDFNLLCLPPPAHGVDIAPEVHHLATGFCEERLAFYLADPPRAWLEAEDPVRQASDGVDYLLPPSPNAALYFPWISAPDPLQPAMIRDFAPGGAIAGVFARTDAARGVWTAPAGAEASLAGTTGPSMQMSDAQQGLLNPRAINGLRRSRSHAVIWGARTLAGNDRLASEWKYVSVRRLALFIERSVRRSLDWTAFEDSDEPLWASVRLEVSGFLDGLFRQGAFQGNTPREGYFVKCDRSTMTQADIEEGRLVVVIGIAPLKPAEFVVITVKQLVRGAD